MRSVATLLPLVTLVVGCVRFSVPSPEIRDYRLEYTPPAIAGKPLTAVLRIAPMSVAAVYDRQLIVYREDEYATGTYPDSRWSANPGNMVGDLLARDFAGSGVYRAVQQGPSALPSDYQLSATIEVLEEGPGNDSCSARLRLRVVLVRNAPGAANPVPLQATYPAEEPCPCNNPPALAAAMSRALAHVSAQLQRDVYEAVAGK